MFVFDFYHSYCRNKNKNKNTNINTNTNTNTNTKISPHMTKYIEQLNQDMFFKIQQKSHDNYKYNAKNIALLDKLNNVSNIGLENELVIFNDKNNNKNNKDDNNNTINICMFLFGTYVGFRFFHFIIYKNK
jgi:hypothetical protein